MSLFFIHGAGANPSVWHLQTARFKDSVALQLPGHPSGVGLTSIREYARVAESQIVPRLQSAVLVGHSMGGAIAIEIALNHPDLRGLVLVGTGARLRVRVDFLAKIRENYEQACAMIASWSVGSKADPVLIDRIAHDLQSMKPEVTLGDFIACDKFDRMEQVQQIGCRTLIVCGEDDRMTPPKYSKYLHEKVRGSDLVLIPDAGHGVMLERHREFNRALEDFLASL